MSRVCYAFQRGDCTRGDECRFAHTAGGEAPQGGYSSFNRSPRDGGGGGGGYSPRGPGVCYAFQRNECERGESCRYSHAAGGATGGYSSSPSGYSRSPRPVGVCYAFQRGDCDKGETCRYSHDSSPRPARATGPCYAFQRGDCQRGESCRYSHEAAAPADE